MFKTSLGCYIIICAISYVIILVNSILDGGDLKTTILIYGKTCLVFGVFYWLLALGLSLIGLI